MVLASQIVDTTKRGIQILNDLLDITRSAFGTDIPIVRAPMNMGHLAVELGNEMQTIANGRTIEVTIAGNMDGAWDRARMGQVFSNLIGNAVQYSRPDSTIFVNVADDADRVAISVHNEGTTIPAEKLITIFEALTRGQDPKINQQGSSHLGLGLYISKKIVLAHGGDLDVASSDEAGTKFTVRLPRN